MKAITVNDSRMESLVVLYDMHTDYFKRALVDITDDAAQSRLDTKANHVAWITGSMVQGRYEMAKLLGVEMQQTHHELFKDFQGIKDGVKYPPLEDFKQDWDKISPILRKLFVEISREKLDSIFEVPEMDMKMSHYEMITFQTYREANCIGQIALWRRLLGYPGLKYED